MGNIYSIGQGMKRIDVPENDARNNLPIGTVLQVNGYNNDRYCIIQNMGINERFPSYGTKYRCINIDDGSESFRDMLGVEHISKKKDSRISTYYTDEVLSPDEIMDLINLSKKKKDDDARALHEKDQARALELDTLKKKYSYLETYDEKGKRSKYAQGAKNIRIELAKAFPGLKFSITSKGFSMGCSIDIQWTDSISREAVEKITDKYQYGTFDSMTDCAGSIDSQFIDLFGGARFVHCQRSVSDAGYNKTALSMGYPEAVFNPKTGNFDGVDYQICEMIKRHAWKTNL